MVNSIICGALSIRTARSWMYSYSADKREFENEFCVDSNQYSKLSDS